MEEINQMSEAARLIADNGVMVVLSAIMIIIFLNLFKKMTRSWEKVENKNNELINTILSKGTAGDYMQKQTEINNNILSLLQEIREGATRECTIEQVKIVTNAMYDLSKRVMVEEAIRVVEENHLDDKAAVQNKVRSVVHQKVNDRKSKLYNFSWKGKPLSDFLPISKEDPVAETMLKEIYAKDGFSESRFERNMELFYDNLKIDLFNEVIAYNKL